jgi:predicted metal-dependent HD superfamily phosphohydrolase
MKSRWFALFPHAADAALRWWTEIERRYTEPQRHYHTLEHLEALFRHFDRHEDSLADREAVAAAIFFHDLIYKPGRPDNEEKSALLAQKALAELGFDEARTAKVQRWILATKRHEPAPEDPDLEFLLDFDLSILAAPWADYRHYAENVRREFAFHPDWLFRPGRRSVLEGFLRRPAIYRRDVLHAGWETAARENLQREITELLS